MTEDKDKEVKKPGVISKETKEPSQLSEKDLEKTAAGTPMHTWLSLGCKGDLG